MSAACEFLGLDPLYVANEGKLVAICAREDAAGLLAAMRAHPLGRDAAQVGEVVEDAVGLVTVLAEEQIGAANHRARPGCAAPRADL